MLLQARLLRRVVRDSEYLSSLESDVNHRFEPQSCELILALLRENS